MREGTTQNNISMMLIGLCLICAGLFASAALSQKALAQDGYLPWGGSTLYKTVPDSFKGAGDKQSQWTTPESVAAVQAGLTVISRPLNGSSGPSWASLIDSIAGGHAPYMKAIILHESSAGRKPYNSSSGALCAFQICGDATLKSVANRFNMTTEATASRLMSDPEFCVRAGYHVLQEKLHDSRSKGDIKRALCLYNGQVTALKTFDWCWAMDEYGYMVRIINNGPVLLDTNNDKKSPDFAVTTVRAADGSVLGQSLNCQDHTTTRLAQAFAKMEDYYKVYTSEVREKAYATGALSMMSSTTRPIPGVKASWCIDDILFYFDLVRAAMDGASVMNVVLTGLLAGVLDRLCQYVITAVQTTANNFLNSVCLPLPDFSFSISGPNLRKTGCNGLSLGKVLAVNGGTLTPEQVTAGMHQLYQGIPGINSLPSFSWQSPSLAGPLRAIFGSTTVNSPSGP